MGLLFRVPLLLLEYLLRRVFGHDREQDDRFTPAAPGQDDRFTPAAPGPVATAPGPVAPVAAAPAPPPPTPLRPIRESGHVDREATVVASFGPASDVGGTITVDEPWDGYASAPAAAIVTRLRGADPATKAVVALYERGHKNRATVLKATS